MKTIVFGRGFLGTRIANKFGYSSVGYEVNPINLDALRMFFDFQSPDMVVNAIGKTGRPNIDWCEENREATVESNIVAAINLCTECSTRGIYFVHIGSGCIYEGDNKGEGFREDDEPNFYGPQFYSTTKMLVEKIIKEFPGLILRIRMPIDDRPHPRNLIDKLAGYKKIIDTQNSMTTVPHMLDALKTLVDRRREGIYNLVNSGTISAKEIMKMYQEIVNPSHTFGEMSLEELNLVTEGIRSNCRLNTEKLESEGIYLLEIREAVRECLLNYRERLK